MKIYRIFFEEKNDRHETNETTVGYFTNRPRSREELVKYIMTTKPCFLYNEEAISILSNDLCSNSTTKNSLWLFNSTFDVSFRLCIEENDLGAFHENQVRSLDCY